MAHSSQPELQGPEDPFQASDTSAQMADESVTHSSVPRMAAAFSPAR